MEWPNVTQYLKTKAYQFGDARLLIDYGTDVSYTYTEFDHVTDRLVSGLRKLGVKPGDRVAFLHPNHSDLLLGYFATIKAGAVAVPMNPAYTAREITHIIKDSGAQTLISTERFAEHIQFVKRECPFMSALVAKRHGRTLEEMMITVVGPLKAEDPEPATADDLAMIFYTSGTTGKPKGVMISHRNITFAASNIAQNYGLRSSDVTVVCLPLNHIFANASAFWGSLASGGAAVVMDRFQTEFVFDAIKRYRLTWFPGVPTMFTYLLSSFDAQPRNVSSLRMGLSGAASLSVEHLKAFEAKFGVTMLEVYGLTESTGLVTANPVHGIRKPGSVGISVSGVSTRLVDVEWGDVPRGEIGELAFKGPNGTPGYWQLPEDTAKKIRNGWIATGDLAYQDGEGYFYIVGRKDELIVSGGYNIFPREIEEVLYRHQDIGEVAVIGVPDPVLGEVPKAFVVTKPGRKITAEELLKICLENLAKYKIPKVFIFVDKLPKNTTGKIVKKELC
jgi:long-chain acyl-CoA synthetase